MAKNLLKILAIFVVGMAGGIFAEEIFWPYFVEKPLFYKYRLEKNPIYVTKREEIYIQENTALKDAISKVEKTVVFIRTKTKAGKTLEGSGFILTSDGLIITLAELVPEGSKISLFIDEEIFSPQVLKRDLDKNLALLKIEKKNLSTTGFFNFEKLKLGERVFLIGRSFENGKVKNFVDEGIIKSFDENKIETNIQPSKEILGTPLFDIEGNLLGINSLTKDGKITSIPITHIRSFFGI
jgi:S1-C subfamily serine protease